MEEKSYIYSIGHGAKTMNEFLEELLRYDIKYLIDVRSKPYSKFYPHFNKDALFFFFMRRKDIKYSWWGDSIGGIPPVEWNCYTPEGKIDYDKMAQNTIFKKSIDRIVNANSKCLKTAIMCSESDPQMCHRSKLIGRMLKERGIEVQHIVRNKRGDIIIRTQNEIFTNIINQAVDLFSNSQEIHLSSRKAYVQI